MAPTTLLGLLSSAPADQTAIILPEANLRISYGNLRGQVTAVATALAAHGISRDGSRGLNNPTGRLQIAGHCGWWMIRSTASTAC